MIDHRFRPWALSLLSLALILSNVCAQTNRISGVLTEDATWSGDNLLQGTVVVPAGRVVTIEPGSRLRHCVVEYADCAGDHKDYYDNDCNPDTPPPARVYFQAVVALACHLDIEDCVFQNLPDGGGPGVWTDVPGRVDVPGAGEMQQMSDAEGQLGRRFYHVSVRP